jgi:uncharacterized cupredoxin-like copper-binding protein
MSSRSLGITGLLLTLAGVVLIGAGALVADGPPTRGGGFGAANGAGYGGMMGGGAGFGGMMGRAWGGRSFGGSNDPGPGETGFVAGTPAAPRVVRILATPNLRFWPAAVRVQAGETVRFEVTVMGPIAHEFMVGPAPDVAVDKAGTPEVTGIRMMQTASLTYTFAGTGPFAFACHAPGHYEAGMSGAIEIVS